MHSSGGGITNEYLEKLGDKILKNNFVGVFPCDLPPDNIKRKTFSIIFNTGKSNTKGEHFISIFVNTNNIFYFDSFGNNISNKFIQDYLKTLLKKRKWHYNKFKIQHNKSIFCGFFAIAFLLSKYKKMHHKTFIRNFSKNRLKQNDKKVVKFIVENI